MEPHICALSSRGTDHRGEWVCIANASTTPVPLTDLELTDYTKTQEHVHIYRFPPAVDGTPLMLRAGQLAYVFTGPGPSRWVSDSFGRWTLLLFAGRRAPFWNNPGDVAYLRRLDGTFVSSLTVGAPTRHPFGHAVAA